MKKLTAPTYKAEVTIGLNKGYTNNAWSITELKEDVTQAQKQLKKLHQINLSAKITPCYIVFLGQDEKSVSISFINYPKFPLQFNRFKTGVLFIAEQLMLKLTQNRIVILFDDETIMLEESEDLDKSIQL